MKEISWKQLIEKRNKFRESKDHKHLPESSLIWGKESTAMFNIAWMQQLIPYLSGSKHPLGTRLYNIQKCIRTVDIDEVGDASHLTFFNMMWNRSLGDYFKKESVQRSREFLVYVLWFDPTKLAVTVFEGDKDTPKDEETAKYWKEAWVPENRIAYLPADNNRRSPGPVWPCGPDTEIFYRVGKEDLPPQDSNPWTDEDNRLEIRNNVFMEFYRDETGKLTKLLNQNVDTWMWFERMCKVLQNKETVYETDVFADLIEMVEKHLWLKYQWNEKRFRVIVDHIRTSFFLVKNGISPSNEWRWYVLRRLIRRMYYNIILLKEIKESEIKLLVDEACSWIAKDFWEKEDKSILEVISKECIQFQKTINNWQKILQELFAKDEKKKEISGAESFKLYDTCWFPLELTVELAQEKWYKVDTKWFEKEMEAQQERSRAWSKDMFKQWIDRWKYLQWISPTQFVWYGKDNLILDEVNLLKDFEVEWQRVLVFDKSPLYWEWWGQMWDSGVVILDNWEKLYIKDTKKFEGVFLHFVA